MGSYERSKNAKSRRVSLPFSDPVAQAIYAARQSGESVVFEGQKWRVHDASSIGTQFNFVLKEVV